MTLKSHLYLSNLKHKNKKQYYHLDSLQKSNETCERTGISRVNSVNNIALSSCNSPNKKPKGRVTFAPKFRLINYIYYDPRETVSKEENKIDDKDESNKEIKIINNLQKNKAGDKVTCQCTCLLM